MKTRKRKHDLLFLNPTFHPGLNVTVRDGNKWQKAHIGDTLRIKKTGSDKVIYNATVTGRAYVPFKLIPQEWLAYEHDPACRTRDGLLQNGMLPAYPDFNEEQYVIILLFSIA